MPKLWCKSGLKNVWTAAVSISFSQQIFKMQMKKHALRIYLGTWQYLTARQCIWNPTEQPQFHRRPSATRCVCERTEWWMCSLMPGTSKSRNLERNSVGFDCKNQGLNFFVFVFIPPPKKRKRTSPRTQDFQGGGAREFSLAECLQSACDAAYSEHVCARFTQSLKLNKLVFFWPLRHKERYFSAFSTLPGSTFTSTVLYY